MTTRPNATILAIAAALLAGCASAPPHDIPAHAVHGVKRFGVVSVTGSEFIRQYVGITVFGNEREVKAIGDWGLDEKYQSQLGAAGEQVLGATFIKADYPTAEFMRVNNPNGPWDAPAFSGANWAGIEATAKATCQKENLDALFVLARRKSGDIFGGTNQRVEGIGIYARRGISVLHLLARIGLIDCKTGKPLGDHEVLRRATLPEELAGPIADWSTESESRIRQQLSEIPGVFWENTLRVMLPQ